ncbi:hypothetical protein DFJ73DRAFT_68146 [Zopfochytrium polystomum]|nr:hypothetical protein DFJ73DRAFT_68146 [Zopfochytrium polystomum]
MKESGRTPSRPSPPPAPQLAPEVRAIHQIDTILAEMQTTVQPLMHGYLQEAEAYISSKAAGAGFSSEDTQRMEKRLKEEHARVGELLLQGLMKVDGVVVPDGHDEVRSRRKEVVRTLNRWLEQVDAMKDKVQEKTKL